jgi:hypothetical protein
MLIPALAAATFTLRCKVLLILTSSDFFSLKPASVLLTQNVMLAMLTCQYLS